MISSPKKFEYPIDELLSGYIISSQSGAFKRRCSEAFLVRLAGPGGTRWSSADPLGVAHGHGDESE